MARLALAFSVRDPAGSGAAEALVSMAGGERVECPGAVVCYELAGGVRLGGYDEDTPFMEFLGSTPDPGAGAVVVLSRHSSESGARALTVHHTGNPTARVFGGEPGRLALSYPALSRALLGAYRDEAEARGLLGSYDLKLEATHHGPTGVPKPVVFIEIGSTPEEWRDQKAREAMAAAVLRVIERGVGECPAAAGFGGGHYPVKFTRIHLEGDYCMGHILAKYAFREGVSEDVIIQAMERTHPAPAEVALVEKKSLRSQERRWLEEVLSKAGYRVEYV